MNNTHNVSYGGSNSVTNVAYSKYSAGDRSSTNVASSSSSTAGGGTSSSTSRSYATATGKTRRTNDQDVVVLLPSHRKSRTPRIRHKLSVSRSTIFHPSLIIRELRARRDPAAGNHVAFFFFDRRVSYQVLSLSKYVLRFWLPVARLMLRSSTSQAVDELRI